MADRVKLNIAGFREIRKSAKVTADLRRRAEAVARAAGPGFEVTESPSKNRARFTVHPESSEAFAANARDNVLVRALEAGRG
jgi:hypothetical protein